MKAKRFKVTLEDDCFTMIDRCRGCSKRISFPSSMVGKVANFCLNACDSDLMVEVKECIRYRGGLCSYHETQMVGAASFTCANGGWRRMIGLSASRLGKIVWVGKG